MKRMLFQRRFKKFQGGHLKVFDYFGHVLAAPGWTAAVRFSADSVWDERNPWGVHREHVLAPEARFDADALFLGGTDWRGLSEADAGEDPFALFRRWFDQAVAAALFEPNAFTLATCTPDGWPSARAVLLKGLQDVVLGDLPAGWKGPFAVGVLSAFGTGLLAIQWLLDYVRRHTYDLFVVYRLIVAAIILLLIATGVREASF